MIPRSIRRKLFLSLKAEIIFTILDGDKSKEIKIDEFVNGTMKLKGSATKLDLMALMYDQTRQNMKFDALCEFVEEELLDIKKRIVLKEKAVSPPPVRQAEGRIYLSIYIYILYILYNIYNIIYII